MSKREMAVDRHQPPFGTAFNNYILVPYSGEGEFYSTSTAISTSNRYVDLITSCQRLIFEIEVSFRLI